MSEEKIDISEIQLSDFKKVVDMFEKFIFSFPIDFWKKVIKQLDNVLKKCDDIDFMEYETAFAYAVWHFLDRYHRCQMFQKELFDNGYMKRYKMRGMDILEIGPGPGQGLFSLCAHYYNLFEKQEIKEFKIVPDFVEKSMGFRNFINDFSHYMTDYNIPFFVYPTNGKDDAYSFKFYDFVPDYWTGKTKKIKYRYDIVLISNFITNDKVFNNFKDQLEKVKRYMRNYGLLIIIGADRNDNKYKNLYTSIQDSFDERFNDRKFFGWWKELINETINYRYDNEYGKILRDYKMKLKTFLNDNNLWDEVSDYMKNKIDGVINQSYDKINLENWDGINWELLVYQKHAFLKK